jgi:hypothetical protein
MPPFRTPQNTGADSKIFDLLRELLTILLDMALWSIVHMDIYLSARLIPSRAKKGNSMADKKTDIHIVVEESVLKAAKIRCIQEDLVLSDVITQLLREWAADKTKTKRG